MSHSLLVNRKRAVEVVINEVVAILPPLAVLLPNGLVDDYALAEVIKPTPVKDVVPNKGSWPGGEAIVSDWREAGFGECLAGMGADIASCYRSKRLSHHAATPLSTLGDSRGQAENEPSILLESVFHGCL